MMMITDLPSRDRNNLRDAIFNSYKDNIPDENDNIILKYLLLTITPNYTNYSMNTFAQKMRLINAMLNRKLYGRGWKKNTNRIVFFNFYEFSKDNNLTHNHCMLRVHKSFNTKKRIEELMTTLRPIVYKFYKDSLRNSAFDYRFRRNAVHYSTKEFSENNDNLKIN